jgi:large subunit ribosomal protein L25
MGVETVAAERREEAGRQSPAVMREGGKVPAVLYGAGLETLAISVSAKEMGRVLREIGPGGVLTLQVAGGPTATARVREIQREPVTRELLHLDFQVVATPA